MRVIVLKDKFASALSKLTSVAGSNKTLPVLSNIKCVASGSMLTLSATNLEVAITAEVGCRVEAEGEITLPARLLNDYVAALPIDRVDFSADGTSATVSAGGYSSSINGIAADEFPELPAVESTSPIKINASDFKAIVDKTLFAVSVDSSRPSLGGVLLDVHDGGLVCVATDSYRLSVLQTSIKTDIKQLIIPRGTIGIIARFLTEKDDIIILPDEGQVGFEIGGTKLVSRLIDGAYPNYRQLIPSESENTALVDRKELINAAKIAGLFSREAAGGISLNVSEAGGEIRVESSTGQVGENNSAVKAEAKGEIKVSLNSKYLMDGLSVFDCDVIELWVTGKLSPTVLRDPKSDDFTHLVMPLRT